MPDTSNNCDVTTDWQSIDPLALYDLFDSVNFSFGDSSEFPPDYMKKIFPSGVYGFFVSKKETLVGGARVFSDDIYCTWIAEICVQPDWQGHGIGRKLMEAINDRFDHTALYAEAFKEQVDFFTKQGIKPKEKLVACSRAPLARG